MTKLNDRGTPHCLARWFHSKLSFRCQTVCTDNQYSHWLYLTTGTRLGPLAFLLLFDDLAVERLTYKHLDDIALTKNYCPVSWFAGRSHVLVP